MSKADTIEDAIVRRLESAVLIKDGNTEINECYYTVEFLGATIWDAGGPYPQTFHAAERAAKSFRLKLRRMVTGK